MDPRPGISATSMEIPFLWRAQERQDGRAAALEAAYVQIVLRFCERGGPGTIPPQTGHRESRREEPGPGLIQVPMQVQLWPMLPLRLHDPSSLVPGDRVGEAPVATPWRRVQVAEHFLTHLVVMARICREGRGFASTLSFET